MNVFFSLSFQVRLASLSSSRSLAEGVTQIMENLTMVDDADDMPQSLNRGNQVITSLWCCRWISVWHLTVDLFQDIVTYASAFNDEELEAASEECPEDDDEPSGGDFVVEEPIGWTRYKRPSEGSSNDSEEVPLELLGRSESSASLEGAAAAAASIDPSLESAKSAAPVKDAYYFYQAADGQHIYIHPLNARCLVKEYGGLQHSPEVITANIVELEPVSMDEDLRYRLRYLSHLPLSCEFIMAELALKPPVISTSTAEFFTGEWELISVVHCRRAHYGLCCLQRSSREGANSGRGSREMRGEGTDAFVRMRIANMALVSEILSQSRFYWSHSSLLGLISRSEHKDRAILCSQLCQPAETFGETGDSAVCHCGKCREHSIWQSHLRYISHVWHQNFRLKHEFGPLLYADLPAGSPRSVGSSDDGGVTSSALSFAQVRFFLAQLCLVPCFQMVQA